MTEARKKRLHAALVQRLAPAGFLPEDGDLPWLESGWRFRRDDAGKRWELYYYYRRRRRVRNAVNLWDLTERRLVAKGISSRRIPSVLAAYQLTGVTYP